MAAITGKEKNLLKERVFAKEKLRQFYSSYKFYIDESIKFVDCEIRDRIYEIEDFFCLGTDLCSKRDKKKRFIIPFTKHSYLELKRMQRRLGYLFNKEVQKGWRELKAIQSRQIFRNMEVFVIMQDQLSRFVKALKYNYHLKELCKMSNKVGESARLYRKQRLKDSIQLMEECAEMLHLCKQGMSINNIDEYIKTFSDFFVQCQFRLDKFVEQANISLFETREMENKMELPSLEKSTQISLELPGWEVASKFE